MRSFGLVVATAFVTFLMASCSSDARTAAPPAPTATGHTTALDASPNTTRTVGGYTIEPNANLTGANLSGADLGGAALSGANLANANLTGAILTNADLTGADLTGANLYGTNLSGATVTGAKLAGAKFDSTGCPDGSNSDANPNCGL
jgi:hypothetical protein